MSLQAVRTRNSFIDRAYVTLKMKSKAFGCKKCVCTNKWIVLPYLCRNLLFHQISKGVLCLMFHSIVCVCVRPCVCVSVRVCGLCACVHVMELWSDIWAFKGERRIFCSILFPVFISLCFSVMYVFYPVWRVDLWWLLFVYLSGKRLFLHHNFSGEKVQFMLKTAGFYSWFSLLL